MHIPTRYRSEVESRGRTERLLATTGSTCEPGTTGRVGEVEMKPRPTSAGSGDRDRHPPGAETGTDTRRERKPWTGTCEECGP